MNAVEKQANQKAFKEAINRLANLRKLHGTKGQRLMTSFANFFSETNPTNLKDLELLTGSYRRSQIQIDRARTLLDEIKSKSEAN